MLDRRITIQRLQEQTNDFNEVIIHWNDLRELWASVEYVRDSERFAASQISSNITMRFQVRYSPATKTITPLDRVAYEGKTFDIVAVKEIGRREFIEITASGRNDLKPSSDITYNTAEWGTVEW